MVRYGYVYAFSIEMIDSVYANGISMSITRILREIRADSGRGIHKLLQYI